MGRRVIGNKYSTEIGTQLTSRVTRVNADADARRRRTFNVGRVL
jgi:hypothetical protein